MDQVRGSSYQAVLEMFIEDICISRRSQPRHGFLNECFESGTRNAMVSSTPGAFRGRWTGPLWTPAETTPSLTSRRSHIGREAITQRDFRSSWVRSVKHRAGESGSPADLTKL